MRFFSDGPTASLERRGLELARGSVLARLAASELPRAVAVEEAARQAEHRAGVRGALGVVHGGHGASSRGGEWRDRVGRRRGSSGSRREKADDAREFLKLSSSAHASAIGGPALAKSASAPFPRTSFDARCRHVRDGRARGWRRRRASRYRAFARRGRRSGTRARAMARALDARRPGARRVPRAGRRRRLAAT